MKARQWLKVFKQVAGDVLAGRFTLAKHTVQFWWLWRKLDTRARLEVVKELHRLVMEVAQ